MTLHKVYYEIYVAPFPKDRVIELVTKRQSILQPYLNALKEWQITNPRPENGAELEAWLNKQRTEVDSIFESETSEAEGIDRQFKDKKKKTFSYFASRLGELMETLIFARDYLVLESNTNAYFEGIESGLGKKLEQTPALTQLQSKFNEAQELYEKDPFTFARSNKIDELKGLLPGIISSYGKLKGLKLKRDLLDGRIGSRHITGVKGFFEAFEFYADREKSVTQGSISIEIDGLSMLEGHYGFSENTGYQFPELVGNDVSSHVRTLASPSVFGVSMNDDSFLHIVEPIIDRIVVDKNCACSIDSLVRF